MFVRAYALLLFLTMLVLQGCVSVQSFPNVARSSDTITLAVGSPDNMTKSNTTAEYVSDSDPSTHINLPIRSIIKIRPDNTSFLANFHFAASFIAPNSSHSPWLSVIAIDLPSNLPVGPGVVNITTGGTYGIGADVNSVPIAMEIVEGTGSASTFTYDAGFGSQTPGDLSLLEPLHR